MHLYHKDTEQCTRRRGGNQCERNIDGHKMKISEIFVVVLDSTSGGKPKESNPRAGRER